MRENEHCSPWSDHQGSEGKSCSRQGSKGGELSWEKHSVRLKEGRGEERGERTGEIGTQGQDGGFNRTAPTVALSIVVGNSHKKYRLSLAAWGSVDWVLSRKAKGRRFNSRSRPVPGLWIQSWSECV